LFEFAKKKGIVPSDQMFTLFGTNYPTQYETYFTTKTGKKLFVRPLKAEDEEALRELLYSYSAEKIYQRFFCFIKEFTHEKTQCMVNINYEYDMALGCFLEPSNELVATAGYFYDSTEHTGEVAFMVRPDMHREGIATFLHDYLLKIAKERGLRGFKAYVLKTNKPMLSVFHKSGYNMTIKTTYDANVLELDLIFNYKKDSSIKSV
jgi:RimJ/RimL family protein N-acetyltransferase